MKKVIDFEDYFKYQKQLKVLKRYRSVVVMAASLIFNLVSSLMVYKPDGVKFNMTPITVTEWVCDIISMIVFASGWLMMFYDINRDQKVKIKEALNESMK